MVFHRLIAPTAALVLLGGFMALAPMNAGAHCDTMSGPVISTARLALDKGDVTPVLKWIKPGDEAEVRAAFKQALAVRKQGKAAKELADKSYFETLVRLHRAGEGASYTGLKDTPVEPIIAKTDAAIAQGSIDDVTKLLTEAMSKRPARSSTSCRQGPGKPTRTSRPAVNTSRPTSTSPTTSNGCTQTSLPAPCTAPNTRPSTRKSSATWRQT